MDKILVVDDIQQNIDLISRYLTNTGYDVITANDGPTALSKARMLKPDLILLDILMPQMSGFEVCKILKSDDTTKYISILIITAIDSTDTKNRSFEVGADDFISKSFDKTLLLSKIKSLLRIKHLSDELKQQYSELQEKNHILNLQLNMAMQVQRSLIEEAHFTLNNVNFISTYLPALDIGGDMYDMIKLDESKVAVIMSDVSGHGISASLLTAMLKMMFRDTINTTTDPSDFLYNMNNKFCSIFTNKLVDVYACMFFAVIDTTHKEISCANAGHTLPIFVDSKRMTAEEVIIKGIPVGMLEISRYESLAFSFEIGDLLFFHTDGLGDSLYKDSYDDFVSQLKTLLISLKDMPVKQVITDVLEQFKNNDDSAKYAADDISIILCKM